ncbi:MAG: phosphoribosyltransferase family protein, partial [Phycisphaerales bacterium JB039]
GRPDLAGAALPRASAPPLLIVGGRDETVLELNRQALERLGADCELEIIPGATHLFEEPGALQRVAQLARDWFVRRLGPGDEPEIPAHGFRDRAHAGALLARALRDYRDTDCVILGLPRGGVEVGAVVARALAAPLDVLLVRKLPAPGQPELALGAIADGDRPVRVVDDQRARALGVTPDQIEAIARRQLAEIQRRAQLYRGARPATTVAGRTAIVVDDGVATGSTAEAALRILRAQNPARLILAVPVGAPDSIESLARYCDRVVCLLAPESFHAVGLFYGRFDQTSDQRVIELLQGA